METIKEVLADFAAIDKISDETGVDRAYITDRYVAGTVEACGHSFMKRSVLCTPALNVLSKDQHRATVPMRREQWEALSEWSDAQGTTASEVVRVLVQDFLKECEH